MLRFGKKKEFAVIGLGRFGSSLALSLEEQGNHVLGIDSNADIVQRLSEQMTQVVALDSTDESALREVDITSFGTVIIAIGSDFESNLLTTVALKDLGVQHVICKTNSRRQREILLKVGADRIVLPEIDAGKRLADELVSPGVLERFQIGPGYSVVELVAPRPITRQTLAQSDLRARYGVTVLAVKRGDQISTHPPANYIVLDEDLLVLLGRDERVAQFSQLA